MKIRKKVQNRNKFKGLCWDEIKISDTIFRFVSNRENSKFLILISQEPL